MRRREFTFGGIAAWSRPAAAQNSENPADWHTTDDAEMVGLPSSVAGPGAGWIDGRNLHIDVRTN